MNPDLMSEAFIDDIKLAHAAFGVETETERIRALYNQFRERDYIKSHLAALFMKDFSTLSRIIHDPNAGRGIPGRPRLLSREQEDEIIQYVRNCQISGHCVTLSEATAWANLNILDNGRRLSNKFIAMNTYVMSALDTASPQLVEDLRIEACYYDNFVEFFNRLTDMCGVYDYIPDLIINVDETTTNAEKSKRATKVLYDPTIEVRPVAKMQPKVEHITLCCSIAASGKALRPLFIIKNKHVTVEDEIVASRFDCGDYGLCWSPNGWQDSVNLLFHKYSIFIIFMQRTFGQWIRNVLIPYRASLRQEQRRILLLMDGHGTHTHVPNMDLCRDNMIDVCFLPPHTSHILQPLDVGIFNSYKAAYRRGSNDPALDDFNTQYMSAATKARVRMLGRALTARMHALNQRSIRRSFFHTGIYPLSFHHFILYCGGGVRNVPPEVRAEATAAVEGEKEADGRRQAAKRRRSLEEDCYLIDSRVDI